jgi:antitoxin component YwqK of YwqJK toxin-antitoxin module
VKFSFSIAFLVISGLFSCSSENADTEESTMQTTTSEKHHADQIKDNDSFSERKDGIHLEKFEDGGSRLKYQLKDGRKNGEYKIWHENGKIAKKGMMKDDKWDGPYREWYANGNLRVEGQYTNGVQDGEWRFYDKNGKPLPPIIFNEGREVTRELPGLIR